MTGTYHLEAQAIQDVDWWYTTVADPGARFALSVAAQRKSGPSNSAYGLVLRRIKGNDKDDAYFFRISDDRAFAFYIGSLKNWTPLIAPRRTNAIIPGGVNRLMVIADNSFFYLYINEKFVGAVVNDRVPSGEVGITLGLDAGATSVIEFDNFEVRTPP
jgi:hypothetical protein